MSEPTIRLRDKLCRELAQSEHDARLQTRREAKRLGDTPPALALIAIAQHADQVNLVLEAIVAPRQPVGFRLGRAVGEVFSAARHFAIDRFIDSERSYRMTLLGLKHGVDVAKLLRVVAAELEEVRLALLCDELVRDRTILIDQADRSMAWFAAHPDLALRWGGVH